MRQPGRIPGLEPGATPSPQPRRPGHGACALSGSPAGDTKRLRTGPGGKTYVQGGWGRGSALLPARGLRPARGCLSCRARWGAGTCRWEALHGETRCPRDRALPGTSASLEPKAGRWQMRDTNAQKPSETTRDSCHLLSDPAAAFRESAVRVV